MKRRTFITLIPGLLAAFAMPRKHDALVAIRDTRPADQRASARMLTGLFSRPADARAIGRRYLREYPGMSDTHVLLADLGLDTTGPSAGDVPALRRHLFDLQQRDFVAGDTVVVNRWILSRTEANLCALLALI